MSADSAGAAASFARILELLPLAARRGGITFGELAELTGGSRASVIRDLQSIVDREMYHPGRGDDIQVAIEGDRVSVWTTGEFDRPVRLTLREAAALDLGLRALEVERAGSVAGSGPAAIAGPRASGPRAGEPDAASALSKRLVKALAWASPEALTATITVQPDGLGEDAIRAHIVDAARERRRIRISYLKPGADPESRTIDPYTVAYAAGHGYAIAHCHARADVRVFRIDRMLEVEPLDARFDVPDDFDPIAFAKDGVVFGADDAVDVDVRFHGDLARRLAHVRRDASVEPGDASTGGKGGRGEDGAHRPHATDATVRFSVADAGWIVRRVLGYGANAEITAPAELRAQVRRAAVRARQD